MPTDALGGARRRTDSVFFSSMALLILAVVFIGFARSYYLAGIYRAPLPSRIIHLHGAAFSLWILFLVAQTSLVAAGKAELHRRLGRIGFALAFLMVILGLAAGTESLARHFEPGDAGVPARAFYIVPVTGMLLFATLIGFGLKQRRNPPAHKRLMLVATIALLDAAFARWPVGVEWWGLQSAQICCYVLLLVLLGYDLLSTGRFLWVTIGSSLLVVAIQQARGPIGVSAPWQSFAAWAQSFARSIHGAG
jgi:hypothetical protein